MASGQVPDRWTILSILNWTESHFASFGIDSPRLTAELLLCHSLGMKRLDLYLQHDRPLVTDELAAYRSLVIRRGRREPVAYITGTKGFWEAEFEVGPGVLIPRPDTETLVEAGLAVLPTDPSPREPFRILELGTGSGAVVVSLAASRPGHRYLATDLSMAALATARANARSQGVNGVVRFMAGSWFSMLRPGERFNLILSNPPYIPSDDIDGLQPEICRFEPRLALDGGGDGLACIRTLVREAPAFLAPGGVLLIEMGADQKAAVEAYAAGREAYADIDFIRDYSGHYRVVSLKKRIANP